MAPSGRFDVRSEHRLDAQADHLRGRHGVCGELLILGESVIRHTQAVGKTKRLERVERATEIRSFAVPRIVTFQAR